MAKSTKKTKTDDLTNIKNVINSLDKDTILKLVEMLGEIQKGQSKKSPKKPTKPPRKRGRPRKNPLPQEDSQDPTDPLDSADSIDSMDSTDQPQKSLPGVVSLRRGSNNKGRKGSGNERRGGKKTPCRTEPFVVVKKRPNNFLKSKLANAHKDDTIIDRKLSGNNMPTPRGERSNLVEVECCRCGETGVIREDLLFADDDGSRWVCDSCGR